MNYTEKYHLPQWVKSDRIMMEDFNAAMTNIESGISSAAAGAESSVRGEIQAVSAAQSAAETKALERLRRMGFDLCQTAARSMAAGAAAGTAKGLAYNGLKTAAERSRCREFLFSGNGGELGPGTTLTLDKLNAATYDWQDLHTESESHAVTVSVRFCAPGRGTLNKLPVWMDLKLNVTNCIPYLRARLFDEDTGEYVYTSGWTECQTLQYGINNRVINAEIPLEAGRNYRLEAQIREYVFFYGDWGIGARGAKKLGGTLTGQPLTSGTITETLDVGTGAVQAIAVVHYSGGNTPVVKAGGKTLTAAGTRQTVSATGTPCTETEFFLKGSWSGSTALTAAFQSKTQDMTVYDVAFYLI